MGGFYIFSWKYVRKASQIQILRIFEPLVEFKFNFLIFNESLTPSFWLKMVLIWQFIF